MFNWDEPAAKANSTDQKDINLFADLQQVIDIQDGFKRLQANVKAYHHVLVRFYHQHKASRLTLMENVRNQDWPALARLAHTLKGSGANLGAKQLANAAAQLEDKIKSSSNGMDLQDIHKEVASLDAAIDEIMTALSLWEAHIPCSHFPKKISTQTFDQEVFLQNLIQLKKVLWVDYVQAINLMEQLLSNTQAGAYQDRLAACFAALNQFDMEVAAEHLEALVLEFQNCDHELSLTNPCRGNTN